MKLSPSAFPWVRNTAHCSLRNVSRSPPACQSVNPASRADEEEEGRKESVAMCMQEAGTVHPKETRAGFAHSLLSKHSVQCVHPDTSLPVS